MVCTRNPLLNILKLVKQTHTKRKNSNMVMWYNILKNLLASYLEFAYQVYRFGWWWVQWIYGKKTSKLIYSWGISGGFLSSQQSPDMLWTLLASILSLHTPIWYCRCITYGSRPRIDYLLGYVGQGERPRSLDNIHWICYEAYCIEFAY